MASSGEGISKTIVITVVIFLALGVVGSYYLVNRPVEIEVEEGEAEETVAYLGEDENNRNLDVRATAETEVEDHGDLSFKVEPRSIFFGTYTHNLMLELKAIGDFDEELDLETFKFTAVETEENEGVLNHIDFMMSESDIDHGEVWPPSENVGGITSFDPDTPAYIGYDLHSNEFEVQNEILWRIPEENVGEDFTLEL